jgi:hypothetical protein
MIEKQVRARLRGEYTYQSERVKNLLRVIYHDEFLAWEQWEEQSKKLGFAQFYEQFRHDPSILGRINGSLRFNFLKSEERREAEVALRDLDSIADKWRAARLQVDQMDARIAQALEKEPQVKSLRETQSQAIARVRDGQDACLID